MPDARRIAKQWLEIDQAFGTAEVPVAPIPHVAAVAAPSPVRATPVAAPPRAAATMHVSNMPVRPATRPVPVNNPLESAAMARISKSSVAMPPIPSDPISNLAPLSADEKIDQLAAFALQTDRELSAYLNEVATRVVFGEGDPNASLMFIGEGPGIEEDRTGRPFVGRSGQLLDKMISALGLRRDQVYIANVVKLRAADPDETGRLKDRPPNPEEVARGLPYLHRQIQIIRPKVIITLGAPAIKHLTGETEGVMKIRGQWRQFRGIPVMPTYHPAFVLRSYTEENRRKVWNDLQAAFKMASES